MIGKPEWFTRRKYGGWGYAPKTWQGWVYIFILIVPFVVLQSLPHWTDMQRMYLSFGWLAIVLVDAAHIMVNLKKDEREKQIEAISDRNAAWVMVLALVVGLLFQSYQSAMNESFAFDPFLFGALLAGAAAKTFSDVVLERRS